MKSTTRIFSGFNRFVLPGLAFKAIVIGGGYATGRELTEFFLSAGPIGGLWAMLIATIAWSVICAVTFLVAQRLNAMDYGNFFKQLLGPFGFTFEILYLANLALVLSVFAAAAGAIGNTLFGLPELAGTGALMITVLVVCYIGQSAAEAVFKYVSVLLYGVFAIFLVMCLRQFGPQIHTAFAQSPPASITLLTGGLTYASYNVIGAVLVLPVLRHLRSGREAVAAGVLAGPLAMIPAVAFFVCLVPFYPQILHQKLPSDYVLTALDYPRFKLIFQLMVFCALLECSVGFVQAFVVRMDAFAAARGRTTPRLLRIALPALIMIGSVFIASAIGLIALIAQGYRAMAYLVLVVFVVPLFTLGIGRLIRTRGAEGGPARQVVRL